MKTYLLHHKILHCHHAIKGLTCDNPIDVNSTNTNSSIFRCESLTLPDCEDRTVYCTFPPERINGGDVTLDNNPSEFYQKTDKCRWTKWFNTGKGSKGDKEYPAEIYAKYTWQVCPDPLDINARKVGTDKIVPKKNKG